VFDVQVDGGLELTMELFCVLCSVCVFSQNAKQPTQPRKQNQQLEELQTACRVAKGAYTLCGLT